LAVLLLAGAAVVGLGLALLFLAIARRRVSAGAAGQSSPQWVEDRTAAFAGLAMRSVNPPIDLLPLWARGPVTRVGRAEENDVVLDSPLVSRRHARIEREGDLYRVIDQGSAYGTYVNDRRVEEAPLRVGDVIRFADRAFRFSGAAEA
jgi:hypothetical protein